jgi:hypothetical protein
MPYAPDVIQTRSSYREAMYGFMYKVDDKNDDDISEEHLNNVIELYENLISDCSPTITHRKESVVTAILPNPFYLALTKGLEIEKDLLACVKLNNNAKSAHKKK